MKSLKERFRSLSIWILSVLLVTFLVTSLFTYSSYHRNRKEQIALMDIAIKNEFRQRVDIFCSTARKLATLSIEDLSSPEIRPLLETDSGISLSVLNRDGRKIAGSLDENQVNVLDVSLSRPFTTRAPIKTRKGWSLPVFSPLVSGTGYLYALVDMESFAASSFYGRKVKIPLPVILDRNNYPLTGDLFSYGAPVPILLQEGDPMTLQDVIVVPGKIYLNDSDVFLWHLTLIPKPKMGSFANMEIMLTLAAFIFLAILIFTPLQVTKNSVIADLDLIQVIIRDFHRHRRVDLNRIRRTRSTEVRRLIKMFHQISESLSKSFCDLEQQATEDRLTGLPNRACGEKLLGGLVDQEELFSIMFLDLDGFKKVNDNLGHDTGDAVLVETANALRDAFRDDDFVCRWGGDEFVVILKGEVEHIIEVLTDRVREKLRKIDPAALSGEPAGERQFPIGASIGIAAFPVNGMTVDDLVNYADEQMYKEKMSRKKSRS